MKEKLGKHLNDVNETYFEHLKMALFFGGKTLWISFAFIIHAFFPFLLVNKGSNALKALVDKMVNRNKKAEVSN